MVSHFSLWRLIRRGCLESGERGAVYVAELQAFVIPWVESDLAGSQHRNYHRFWTGCKKMLFILVLIDHHDQITWEVLSCKRHLLSWEIDFDSCTLQQCACSLTKSFQQCGFRESRNKHIHLLCLTLFAACTIFFIVMWVPVFWCLFWRNASLLPKMFIVDLTNCWQNIVFAAPFCCASSTPL